MSSASTFSDGRSVTGPHDPKPVLSQPEIENLAERPLKSLIANAYLHGINPETNQVIVGHRQQALSQLRAHSISNLRSEVGGVLLGHAYRDGNQLMVEIIAALPARNDDHGPIHFTFTADAWSQIHRERADKYPYLEIVGWFHTHPGLGVFYSSDDVVVHTAAFTLPWHVGLVIDPLGNEASYFGWQEGRLTPISGFFEVLDEQETPIVPWKVAKTEVWHNHETNQFYASLDTGPSDTLHPADHSEKLIPLSRSTLIGIVGFVVGFFLLFGMVLALNNQVNSLESVVASLADETALNASLCPNEKLRIIVPTAEKPVPAGQDVAILGTAVLPDAVRYQVDYRAPGADQWELAGIQRRHTELGLLITWDTFELPSGWYELRLTAVDRQNIPLPGVTNCQIAVELLP